MDSPDRLCVIGADKELRKGSLDLLQISDTSQGSERQPSSAAGSEETQSGLGWKLEMCCDLADCSWAERQRIDRDLQL